MYLQTMIACGDDGPSESQTGDVLNILKDLATELGCTVLVLSQINRKIENRRDKHPKTSNFVGIKKPLEIADYVMLLYRDSYYNRDCDRTLAEIKVAGHKTERDLFVGFDGCRFYIE